MTCMQLTMLAEVGNKTSWEVSAEANQKVLYSLLESFLHCTWLLFHRTQVASLSAELSAERKVSEESREQVATARTQANKYQAQVRVH